ncbi:MAG: hypothetical protein NVS4B5_16630 [Vulcanimicrobiaceae bacterium]
MTRDGSTTNMARPRATVRARYLLALAITALVAVAQFAILFDEIYAQRQQSRVVDVASTQRTLSVEIASLASALVDASDDERPDVGSRLRADVDLLVTNERDLTDEKSATNPRGWPPASVRAMFAGGDYVVSNRTRDFARHAIRLLATPRHDLVRRNDDLIFLSNVGPDLAYRYGAIVAAYLDDGHAQRNALLVHESLGLVALLVTLILELPLIFTPLEAELERQVRALVTDAYKRSGAERIAHLGTWERDVVTGRVDWSDELRRICMLEPSEPTPDSFVEFDHPGETPSVVRALATARQSQRPYRIDHRIRTRSGETRWVHESVEFVHHEDGSIAREFGTAFDVTDRKLAEIELFRQANYDVLTGLPNRRYFRDRVETELEAARAAGTGIALLYVDIDRFKSVNDSLGHATGDDILRHTAARLRVCVRACDVVARTGGDEFIVLVTGLSRPAEAEQSARRIVESCGKVYDIGGSAFYAPLSIGVATFPYDAQDVDGLMRGADRAMYEAKQGGGGRYASFNRSGTRPDFDRFALETQLRGSLERDELVVHYQPIVGSDGRTIALEALVRWQHPEHGLLGPDRFISIAEETGLIHAIGTFVLARASAFVRTLQTGEHAGLRLAVNVSSRQFRDRAYATSVGKALARTNFDASLLDLEITESTVMHDIESAIATMHALKAMQVRISIDDFGTGFSSLAYLRRFPIDTLKIDRTFVRELPGNASDAAIVESIVGLARNLRLGVVAEGIETVEQAELLIALRCSELQGYFFSRPMPTGDVAAWLARPPARVARTTPQLSIAR